MHMINAFRRLVVLQVLLGIVTLGMAERNPVMLLIVGAVACLSWYVTEGPTGRLLPRWLTLVGVLLAVIWLPVELVRLRGHLVAPIAHFVMWLQILLLYSERTNREYAQILVLSLLQMISAAVISQSGPTLIFAGLLLAYCVVGLLTVLSFHFKISSDAVYETNRSSAPKGTHVERPESVAGRGHRWQFRVTALWIALGCAAVAVLVFLLTPRREPRILTERLIRRLAQRRPGFSRTLDLRGSPSTGRDRAPIMSLSLREGDFSEYGTDRLLRGAALDRYDAHRHLWTRSTGNTVCAQVLSLPPAGRRLLDLDPGTDVRNARITVFETSGQRLFSFNPPSHINCPSLKTVVVNIADDLIDARGKVEFPLTYEVESPILRRTLPPHGNRQRITNRPSPRTSHGPYLQPPHFVIPADYASGWNVDTERIASLARSALEQANLHRAVRAPPSASDERAVAALADFLHRNFTYTLRHPDVAASTDPIVAFLFGHRSGHCELFASALTAMARSLGMSARVVTGYRVSEFNAVGDYYVVRRQNAHAWTEVYCGSSGWRSADATPPRALAAEHNVSHGVFSTLRDLYEHMEFAWIQSVVSFNEQNRVSIFLRVRDSLRWLTRNHAWDGNVLTWWRRMISTGRSDRIVQVFILVMIPFILMGLAMLTRILVARRRRLVALQLTRLPRHQRRLLVRHLRFYLIMLDRLERHGYVRPTWMSPFGFAQQLAASDGDRFSPVLALTQLFYEVRFGYRTLDDDRRRRIRGYLHDLELIFTPKNP